MEPVNSGGGELTKDGILDILNEPDEAEEKLDLKEEKEEKEEVETEEKEGEEEETKLEDELEEELKEPTEDDLELVTPVRRREILAKYPTLFKDFPYLEKAYYREQKFTEVFPTIPDAEAAKTKADIMDNFETEVIQQGNIGAVFEAIKDESPEAFNKVVDNLFTSIQKIDGNVYNHLMGNVIKSTIITMIEEAQELGDNGQPLKAAANILNQFVFGSQKFTPPGKLSREEPKDDSREKEISEREQRLVQEKFESARDDLQTRTDNVLKATIEGNIDPRKSMTDYVRKNATRDAFNTLEEMIGKDSRFRTILDTLWDRAAKDNFSQASKDRIRAAYLSKAKTLLPTVIKKARSEALRGSSKHEETPARKGPISVGRSASHSGGKDTKEIPKGMSTKDFFLQD